MARNSTVFVVSVCLIATSGGPLLAQRSALTTLPENAPSVVQYRFGPLMANPRLTVPEIGHDSNAFNESTSPRQDYVIKFLPEVDLFADTGRLRFAVNSGATFTYFHRFASERSVAEQIRGRAAARLGRLEPWIGGASIRSNERTVEIDARASRVDRELAAGVQYELSPLAAVVLTANRFAVRYAADEVYGTFSLTEALDRRTDVVAAAVRLRLTPFTTVTLRGYGGREAFTFSSARDSATRGGEVEASFSPEAVIRGRVAIGFRSQDFDDPMLATFRGVTGRGGLTTMFSWRALLGVDYVRDVQYSFDRAQGYFVEQGGDVVYTQKIGGPIDVQVSVARRALDYSARTTDPSRSELQHAYRAGVGYALDSGSRFGLTYEFADRRGAVTPDRGYSRRRVFASYAYEFWK